MIHFYFFIMVIRSSSSFSCSSSSRLLKGSHNTGYYYYYYYYSCSLLCEERVVLVGLNTWTHIIYMLGWYYFFYYSLSIGFLCSPLWLSLSSSSSLLLHSAWSSIPTKLLQCMTMHYALVAELSPGGSWQECVFLFLAAVVMRVLGDSDNVRTVWAMIVSSP